MSTTGPLNDEEVFNEMKKMVAFIKQEAIEKAREIKVKADEEFNIEKAKIVRQESLNIDAVFERKIKQAEVQKRIAQSNHINKTRLKILQERQQVLDEVFEEANQRIHQVSDDQETYAALLEGLVLQSAYALMEPEMVIRCREKDVDAVNGVLEAVADKYEETMKHRPTFTISEEYLPESSAGGVIMSGHYGKITVNNTLDARLDIVKDEMLPQIRVALFGHSPNRSFFD
ncbi:ATPase, V1/A1 complex, subunit E [Rhizopus microsporus ATCC 52813]|uniref:ATPase, V1/A1 complex, subunit E n=1 Tax=Rhizopus microsporus ATCC 52813 TaxID=1340429 RepID=A0A2G4T290_RHIZD|nr:ATPase, V1/A1 complex, subunit E [Rhizopus microsporus ATCC 52813]PHZ15124.1 ATPase, V1/A1 complex, subunit E [Rhizopus microsporus ATCC 52813]